MSDAFDPYYQWLAIPPEEQPPHHYRLLGLKLYEDNPDVIESAADRQMKHVRGYQGGRHADTSQQLLNELAAARLTLLAEERKSEYDAQLRRKLKPAAQPKQKAAAVAKPPAAKAATSPTAPVIRTQRRRPRSGSPLSLIVGVSAAGIALLLLLGVVVALSQRNWGANQPLITEGASGVGSHVEPPPPPKDEDRLPALPAPTVGDVHTLEPPPPDQPVETGDPAPTTDPPINNQPTGDLLAHWTFDEADGDTAVDVVGGHDGTIRGATRVAGVLGGAMRFDGVDDVVVIGNPDALNFSGPISLTAWVRLMNSGGRERRDILTHGYHLQPDRYVYLRLNDADNDQVLYEAGSWTGPYGGALARHVAPGYDTWNHIAGVYDGAAWRLYRNGELVDSRPNEQGAVTVPDDWAIGAHPNGKERRFVGDIDDVRLYGRALSADEVREIWQAVADE